MSQTLDAAVVEYAEAARTDRDAVERELSVLLRELATMSRTATALPESERAALAAVDTPADVAETSIAPRLRGALARHGMAAAAVRLDEAAGLLRITASAIRRVIGTQTGGGTELLGTRDERGRWLLFSYQLPDEEGVGGEPGSPAGRRVQRALPSGMDSLAVQAWWEAPNAGLCVEGEEWSPRAWLAAGGDVQHLIAVATAEGVD